MISKRILVITVCVAVLAVAIGAYAYNSINNASNERWDFIFEWSAEEQDIVDGTLQMKMKFAIRGDFLSFLVKINDKNISHNSWLLMVFDMNHSGAIEVGEPCYVFYYVDYRSPSRTNNAWWNGHGAFSFACGPEYPSPYHGLFLDESEGYIYIITIPRPELNLVNDLIIVSYCGAWKQFNLGVEI